MEYQPETTENTGATEGTENADLPETPTTPEDAPFTDKVESVFAQDIEMLGFSGGPGFSLCVFLPASKLALVEELTKHVREHYPDSSAKVVVEKVLDMAKNLEIPYRECKPPRIKL